MLKDVKTLLVFFAVTLSLLIISYVLASWFWGKDDKKQTALNNPPAGVYTNTASNDSFKAYYTGLLVSLNQRLDSFVQNTYSIKNELDKKLEDYYFYKNYEPVNILQEKTPETNAIASSKIEAIQKQAVLLDKQTKKVDAENKRADVILKEVAKKIEPAKPVAKTVNPPVTDAEKNNNTFAATELTLAAISTGDENKERETYAATDAEKITGSFVVKNNTGANLENEVMVVVVQPDGRIMKNSPWESGVFVTTEGRKVYSCKMKHDYGNGEAKRLNFSICADDYQKGAYTLQVYTNGKKIGEIQKSLF